MNNANTNRGPYNLIINLDGTLQQTELLTKRIKKNNEGAEVKVLHMQNGFLHSPTKAELEAFKKIDPFARIYIIGHAASGSPYISHSHCDDVANYLSRVISPMQSANNQSVLRISLLACHSSLGGVKGEDSFAGRLQRALLRTGGIYTRITARSAYVSITPLIVEHGKSTLSTSRAGISKLFSKYIPLGMQKHLHKSKVPGSKQSFVIDSQKQQFVIDSQLEKFCKKTMVILGCLESYKIFLGGKHLAYIQEIEKEIRKCIGNNIYDIDCNKLSDIKEQFCLILEFLSNEKNNYFADLLNKSIVSALSVNFDRNRVFHKIGRKEKEEIDAERKNKFRACIIKSMAMSNTDLEKLKEFFIEMKLFYFQRMYSVFSYKLDSGLDCSVDETFFSFLSEMMNELNKMYEKESGVAEIGLNLKSIFEKTMETYRKQLKSHASGEKDVRKMDLKYGNLMEKFYKICMEEVSFLERKKNDLATASNNIRISDDEGSEGVLMDRGPKIEVMEDEEEGLEAVSSPKENIAGIKEENTQEGASTVTSEEIDLQREAAGEIEEFLDELVIRLKGIYDLDDVVEDYYNLSSAYLACSKSEISSDLLQKIQHVEAVLRPLGETFLEKIEMNVEIEEKICTLEQKSLNQNIQDKTEKEMLLDSTELNASQAVLQTNKLLQISIESSMEVFRKKIA